MVFAELFLIALGLSADAFAVSVCKGLGMKRINRKGALIIATFFGGFQAIMPLFGWLCGTRFRDYIVSIDHWIAFILLSYIGGKMINSAVTDSEHEVVLEFRTDYRELFMLAIATSIDALAVGITFAFLGMEIIPSITVIGITTFVISLLGVFVGFRFGSRFEKQAEISGGIILIFLGIKILITHIFNI